MEASLAAQWRVCAAATSSATILLRQHHAQLSCGSRSVRRPVSLDTKGISWSMQRLAVEKRKRGLTVHATASPLDLNANVHATASPLDLNANESVQPLSAESKISEAGWLDAFHRFTRPHTIIGTAIGIISISLLAIQSPADFSSTFWIGLLQALVPALFMNVYIVGLNQIYDIEIDKVNKPYLPLASGEYSLATGISIVISSALLSFGIAIMVNSRPLLWALTVSFVLGTAYSVQVPFLRWKQSAVAAAGCILSVRAVVIQLAFYLHMQVFVLKRAPIFPRSLLFATGFMCFFSIVIALFKDIPDLEGDRSFGIQSFTVRVGQKKVFWLCIGLLESAYLVAMITGATANVLWSKVAMVAGHAVMASILWRESQNIDLTSKAAISAFYMFVWKLFYAEYLLIPLMR